MKKTLLFAILAITLLACEEEEEKAIFPESLINSFWHGEMEYKTYGVTDITVFFGDNNEAVVTYDGNTDIIEYEYHSHNGSGVLLGDDGRKPKPRPWVAPFVIKDNTMEIAPTGKSYSLKKRN